MHVCFPPVFSYGVGLLAKQCVSQCSGHLVNSFKFFYKHQRPVMLGWLPGLWNTVWIITYIIKQWLVWKLWMIHNYVADCKAFCWEVSEWENSVGGTFPPPPLPRPPAPAAQGNYLFISWWLELARKRTLKTEQIRSSEKCPREIKDSDIYWALQMCQTHFFFLFWRFILK